MSFSIHFFAEYPGMHRRSLLSTIILLSLILALLVFSNNLSAQPSASGINAWDSSNEDSTQTINHSVWQTLLDKYLDDAHSGGVNLFHYGAVTKDDVQRLSQYINYLEQTDPTATTRAEQMAYWINFYNALTVKVVLEEYPVDSIKKVGSFFNLGPWDKALVTVNGQELSLNDIEHGILRPIYRDPRIHYAVNCASYSCPNLLATVFTAANTEQLLEQAAKDYINHPRGLAFKGDDLLLSSIFDWYAEDFGENQQDLLAHLKRYAEPSLAKRLEGFNGDIDYDYDWQLNDIDE